MVLSFSARNFLSNKRIENRDRKQWKKTTKKSGENKLEIRKAREEERKWKEKKNNKINDGNLKEQIKEILTE